ncbi:hypothetical protein [Algoriphagus machipongonensis]|uniref:IrrE N-terminal-like domain-containing protein n=1 Tax=Algoriphagus machipongonensis TaxID=388413 RepID=A3HZ32_9BACT|nr:hypothetical protein [Algoriphagus machipongonensis]EAZ80518.1 hypothetical protein ALPR1_06330 [Algoriphagus machipongonensis]
MNYQDQILSFLKEIGIPTVSSTLDDSTFLPGLKIDKGTLFYDPEKLKYPGDLLHEAGHIALMTKEEKETIAGNVKEFRPPGQDNEMGVMCWTYAALVHLGLPPEVVFHPDGYKGDSEMLIMEYTNGQYRGLPLLVWMELCDYETFPKMKKWIRS